MKKEAAARIVDEVPEVLRLQKVLDYIKILGITYKVEYYGQNERHDLSMGAGNSKLGVIHICKDMPEDVQRSTLFHEIIHQVSEKLGLGLTEAQILSLESGLFPFFKERF